MVSSASCENERIAHTKQRPTAKDLLKHKFIKTARKATYLTELIERSEKWKAEGGAKQTEETPRDATLLE